jgi:hypothetical protein
MKIKIAFTVEIDSNIITAYQNDLGAGHETKSDFIKTFLISAAVGTLDETLLNNGFGYNTVKRVN